MNLGKLEMFSDILTWIYRNVVSGFFLLIMSALMFVAAVSTCFISIEEKIYFLPDSVGANLLAAVAAMILSLLFYLCRQRFRFFSRIDEDNKLFLRLRLGLVFFIWFLASLWVLCVPSTVASDRQSIFAVIQDLADRDFSVGSHVSYIFVFNNQTGFSILMYCLSRIFGENNFIAYQLMNAVFIALAIRELSIMGGLFGMNNSQQLWVLLLGISFCPLIMYSSFIYGTVPGLACAFAAIRFEIMFFKSGKWHKAVLSGLLIGLAVLCKINYLIFLVAMVIYAIVEILHVRKPVNLGYIAVVAIFFALQAKIPTMAFEKISGLQIPPGVSKWSWVAMGLMDDDNPGWFNGYNTSTFEQSDYDVQRQELWVKTDIKLRLSELWHDRDSARNFFVRKTASQWNEPSFQSVWVSMVCPKTDSQWLNEGSWGRKILTASGNNSLTEYLNYLNFIILFGAILSILVFKETRENGTFIPAMVLIGGFAFHMVWEAKSQYTLPYFTLLLPYTVMGYSKAAKMALCLPAAFKSGGIIADKKTLVIKLILLLVALAILWYVFHGTLESLTGDAEAYFAYLASS